MFERFIKRQIKYSNKQRRVVEKGDDMKKKWTKEEMQYLKNHWNMKTAESLAERLGRTEDSLLRKAGRMGLNVHKEEEELIKRKWTKEEDEFVIRHYKKMSSEEISLHINRTASSIRKRARALNVSAAVTHWAKEEEQLLLKNGESFLSILLQNS